MMIAFLLATALGCAAAPRVNVMPQPESVQERPGEFRFGGEIVLKASPACAGEALYAKALLGKGGIKVGGSGGLLELKLDPAKKELGDEGYVLDVEPRRIQIVAPHTAGIFYGLQTLRQLLPPDAEGPHPPAWTAPCAHIEDKPKFKWRGMMLDDSRHFFPKKDIERLLDLLSLAKINVFHWHLNDDGGWRWQVNAYPKLTDWGAWRLPSDGRFPEYSGLSFPGPGTGQKLYGGFHTQDDLREIVKYAAARHITVVPEIEMPGHNLAATSSYPELICSPSLVEGFRKEEGLVFPNIFCAGKESTYKFAFAVIDEALKIFPSKVIHIGGDEVDKWLWTRCPDCLAKMKAEGLATPAQLESYFVDRIEKHINEKGRRIIGWDEILEGGVAKSAAVMSWRGMDGGIAAAKAGHDVVMTPMDELYFAADYERLPIERVLAFNPVPAGLPADAVPHILGAQACLWTEEIYNIAQVEEQMFPRIFALAQNLWTGPGVEATPHFMARLGAQYERLQALGVHFHLPAPSTAYSVVEQEDGAMIRFGAPPASSVTLRYTVDGSEPTAQSPVFFHALPADSPVVVKAAYFTSDGRQSATTRVEAGRYEAVATDHPQPGLRYRVFEGRWSRVPDFTSLTPVEQGVAPEVGIQGGREVNYAIEFTGLLKIPVDGVYRLSLRSDDGSMLWIGKPLVVDNDGLHGKVEAGGSLWLQAGFYPLRVGFLQAAEGQYLRAFIEGPQMPKQPIPASLLFHAAP